MATAEASLLTDRSEWKTVRFGDVIKPVKENVDPGSSGLTRYVAGEHMQTDDLRIRSWGEIGDGYLGPAFHRRFKAGQVLYGSRRTYLRKVAVPHFDGVCANTTFVLEPNGDGLIRELLPFIMQTKAFSRHAVEQSKGSVNPYVNWKDLAWYEFALPPQPIQRRIAELLWAAYSVELCWRDARTRATETWESHRAAIFSKNDSSAQDSVSLESICAERVRNGIHVPKTRRQGSVGLVNMGELFTHEFVPVDHLEAITLPEGAGPGWLLAAGDLLFARRSIVLEGAGSCSLVPELAGPTTFDSSIIRVRLDPDQALPLFLLHYFRSPAGKRHLRAITRRGAVAGIASSDLRRIPVPRPDLDTQRRLVEALESGRSGLSDVDRHVALTQATSASLRVRMLGS